MLAGYSGLKGGSEGRKRRRKVQPSIAFPLNVLFLPFLFLIFLQLCDGTGIFERHKIRIEKMICCNLMRIFPDMFTRCSSNWVLSSLSRIHFFAKLKSARSGTLPIK